MFDGGRVYIGDSVMKLQFDSVVNEKQLFNVYVVCGLKGDGIGVGGYIVIIKEQFVEEIILCGSFIKFY